ncbi:TetR family transcriptional regulator [Microbacterium protaetiae]|uniref:TetR family transcriptional regulator n=1 Tax=Microbacterium protaetiae TaxID=2509458 RepID=A0A4P6ELN8_9MICO|nr:TetR/AcrR family transcriptional regulator [Microbacterium protaetiae]QAY61137.1 TetR family transcriptional regulator [Microbacterium protaetiae]
MSDPAVSRPGRPKVSSRATLAEAACELFLEQGFAATAIVDITRRAGVSRSSFFNYFGSKSDILWAVFDERMDAALRRLSAGDEVRPALAQIAGDFAPDALALALVNAEAMGIADELDREAAVRRARIADAAAHRLEQAGLESLRAAVMGAAFAGAVWAAVRAWAHDGAGRAPLQPTLERALALVPDLLP